MEISASSFSVGVAAIQMGQQRAESAAQNIAHVTASSADMVSLSEQLLQLEMARQQVEAGSKVVATNNQTLGALIDTHA